MFPDTLITVFKAENDISAFFLQTKEREHI